LHLIHVHPILRTVQGNSKKATSQDFSNIHLGVIVTKLIPRSADAFAMAGIGVCFIAWASLFIHRTSFVGIDGRRYFCLFDDAMISMRYAWNLSHGLGLVWNPGEYVEGYTNPLMTLLMSLPTLVFDKVDAVLAIQVLGVVFMLANAYLMMLIAGTLISGQEQYRRLVQALAFLCGLSYYPLVYWSLMGMETGLLTVLLSFSVLLALRYVRDLNPIHGVLLSVSLGLAFLTRTDAVILAVPIFIYVFYAVRKSERSPSLSFLLAMASMYGLFIVGQELFRWSYYGEWLPNTYILKVSGIPLSDRIRNGIMFVVPFLKEVYLLLIVVGAGIVFDFRRDKLFLVSLPIVLVCYQVWAGGDAWNYWRMLSPAVPITLVLVVYEIRIALEIISGKGVVRQYFLRTPILPRRHILSGFTCFLLLAILVSVNFRFLPEIVMLRMPYDTNYNINRVNAALAIEQVTKPTATVGVFGAGAIPYYSGRPAIDFLGRSDRRIARLAPNLSGEVDASEMIYRPGHNKSDLQYSIKELRPTYTEGFDPGVVDWAKSEYVKVSYEGVPLYLLKSSEDVRWDNIKSDREEVEATIPTLQELRDGREKDAPLGRGTYTLDELPPPEPVSADYGSRNVEVYGNGDLYAHPPSGATFTIKNEQRPVSVAFTPSFISDVPAKKTDGVTFEVWSGEGRLYQKHVLPDDPTSGVTLDLPEASTKEVLQLSFVTRVGPSGDRGWDWALWHDVRIVVGKEE
jgi:arabinofuranosyltransferase